MFEYIYSFYTEEGVLSIATEGKTRTSGLKFGDSRFNLEIRRNFMTCLSMEMTVTWTADFLSVKGLQTKEKLSSVREGLVDPALRRESEQ